MFTDKQIQEIETALSHLGIKDFQFKNINDLNSDSEFMVIRNFNNNKISLEDIVKYLSENLEIEDNTDTLFPEYSVSTFRLRTVKEPITYCNIDVTILDNKGNKINDATIIINNDYTDNLTVLKGTRVAVVILKKGYNIVTDSFVVDEDVSKVYILEKEK